MTALEREEAKKKEKMEQRMSSKKDDNEEVDRSTWAKYSLGLKHQVFGLFCVSYILLAVCNAWCRTLKLTMYVNDSWQRLRSGLNIERAYK